MAEVPPLPSLNLEINTCVEKLRSGTVTEIIPAILYLIKHASDEIDQPLLESRIVALIEAGVGRTVS